MSNEQEKCNCAYKKYGYTNKTFFNRPHWTRRQFFQLAGAGVTGSFLAQRYARAADVTNSGMTTQEHGAERDLHSTGGSAQPYRHLRFEGRAGRYACQLCAGNREWRSVAHRACCRNWDR